MGRALAALFVLLLPLVPASARPIVVSPGPEALSVTLYRDPYRGADEGLDSDWLGGYALITETRTVSLPAGESEIRFEGVAGGILAVSAIVRGLPGGMGEKNRDARLLSPGTLVDAALGRHVRVRRTNPVTGAVAESRAMIRSGPDGVLLQSAEGIEALRCSGLPETIVYDALPEGLSDKPTLAVTASSPAPATASLTLAYLARGFDWQADYVVHVAPDGRTLDLFAWLTLANGNDESFPDAGTQAVAGKVNREDDDDEPEPVSSGIQLKCWPRQTTSDIPSKSAPITVIGGEQFFQQGTSRTEDLINELPQLRAVFSQARQEELGDLKLYRLPGPVTVAAHSQKQVALLQRSKIAFERLYAAAVELGSPDEDEQPMILLRTRNVAARGLGLPLPSGRMAVFERGLSRPIFGGEASVDDVPIGQDLDIVYGESPNVRVSHRLVSEERKVGAADDDEEGWTRRKYEVEISNAGPAPAEVETTLRLYRGIRLADLSRKVSVKTGRRLWVARVPAHGRATLTYEILPSVEEKDDEEADDGES
ncbi:MAG TPA: hypothetical protein VIT45_02970 [Allosphingosinicella sp.]